MTADSAQGIARADCVAVVEDFACHGILAYAPTRVAFIDLGAEVVIVAVCTIWFLGAVAISSGGIATTCRIAVVYRDAYLVGASNAEAFLAAVIQRAEVPIITIHPIRDDGCSACTRFRDTASRNVALVDRGTFYRILTHTNPGLTIVQSSTEIIVITGGTVRLAGLVALASALIAGPRKVTIVQGGADLRCTRDTATVIARVVHCTAISIVTCRAVDFILKDAET